MVINNWIKTYKDLDPNKVKNTFSKYSQDEVKAALDKRGITKDGSSSNIGTSWTQVLNKPNKIGSSALDIKDTTIDTTQDKEEFTDLSNWWVRIPWVNYISKNKQDINPKDIGWDITDKITSWTEWSWTDWITWKTWYEDTNWNGIIEEWEMSWDYKTFYDWLSDTEKKLFLAKGQNAMDNNLDIAEEYANFMRDYETTKWRTEQNEDYRLKQEWISKEMSDIQQSQTMRRATEWVEKLKQSIRYMWDMWMPWTSAQRVVSLENQVNEAETSLRELAELQWLANESRALWKEQNAIQYERQMEDLTTKLNDNIDKSIQSIYNSLIEADNNWQLDTISELESFRDKMYKDLDTSITWFTDASISQMEFLIKEVNSSITEQREYEAKNNQVDMDMSTAKWVYTNKNWWQIIGSDWAPIKVPRVIPEWFEPFTMNGKFYSPKLDANWELVLDENWMPTFWSTSLENSSSITAQTAAQFARMVSDWTISLEKAIDINPSLATNEAFLKAITAEAATSKEPDVKVIAEDEYGKKTYWSYNKKTWKWEPIKTDIWEASDWISEEDAKLWTYSLEDWTEITATAWLIKWLNKIMAINPDIQFDVNNLYRTQEDQYRLYGKWRTAEELKKAWIPEEYAQPDENQVTWSTTSSHMAWNAVDIVLPEWADKVDYYNQLDESMKAQWFIRPEATKAKWDYGHYQYVWIEPEKTESKYSEDATSWATNIQKWVAKLSDITWNPRLRTEVSNYLAKEQIIYKKTDPKIVSLQQQYDQIKDLVDWKEWWTSWYWDDTNMESIAEDVSWIWQKSPYDALDSSKKDYLASIDFVLKSETLNQLINIKAQWGTFGALSDKELQMLEASAWVLNKAMIKDKDGKLIWFDISETKFKKELKTLITKYDTLIKSLTWEQLEALDKSDEEFFNKL